MHVCHALMRKRRIVGIASSARRYLWSLERVAAWQGFRQGSLTRCNRAFALANAPIVPVGYDGAGAALVRTSVIADFVDRTPQADDALVLMS